MSSEADVIRLVQRADWTRLSLTAEVNDGSRVLLAPGRRYREQTPDGLRGCDGERPWRMPSPGEDRDAHWTGKPQPPLPMLFCPAWLLRSSRIEVRGHVTACGRDALHVVATERATIGDRVMPRRLRSGQTEALVDAELGILLRVAWFPPEDADPDIESPEVTELVSLDLDPATDAAQFAAPPGSVVGETWSEAMEAGGPALTVAKTAAGLAAGGLSALIRYWPTVRARADADPADPEAAMSADDPAPEISLAGRPAGPEVGDEVLRVLHDSGNAAFQATMHQWYDYPAIVSQLPEGVRRSGFGGLGMLLDTLAEHPGEPVHTVSVVRVGGPGRFQIDHQHEVKRRPKTIACDGQRRWVVFQDRMTVGPARQPPSDIADLADASWLLECRIAGGALIMADDRPAYRLDVVRGDAPWLFFMLMFPAAVAVVDAELGIILSLTSYLGGKPVRRYELRDVTSGPGDFRVDLPPGLDAEPEPDRPTSLGDADSAVTPLKLAGAVAHEVGKEAAKAARNFLRRLGSP
jgi:hypothetical protein